MSNENESLERIGIASIDGMAITTEGSPSQFRIWKEGDLVWRGKPEDLAALICDAKRYRKLEKQHDGCTGAQWCARYGTAYYSSPSTLAEIADALPEVET